jgi:hypothetical protein
MTIGTELRYKELNNRQHSMIAEKLGGSTGVIRIGRTRIGEETVYWQYGLSHGMFPVEPAGKFKAHREYFDMYLDTDSSVIYMVAPSGHRTEWDLDGKEIVQPPFELLVHVDIRRLRIYREQVAECGDFPSDEARENFFRGCGVNSHSTAPCSLGLGQLGSGKAGYAHKGDVTPWLGNIRVKPWELTEELTRSAVSIKAVRLPGGILGPQKGQVESLIIWQRY